MSAFRWFVVVAALFPGLAAADCKDVCTPPRVCSGKPPHENCMVPFRITPDKEVIVLAPASPEELSEIAEMAKRGEANVR